MIIREYSIVVTTKDIETGSSLREVTVPKGTIGTVVYIYTDGSGFEVEFNVDGKTWIESLPHSDVEFRRIPIEECKEGFLYRVHSRNFNYGVFVKSDKRFKKPSFLGVGCNFGKYFIETEFHYDSDDSFGTASPNFLIKECPVDWTDNDVLLNWLKENGYGGE